MPLLTCMLYVLGYLAVGALLLFILFVLGIKFFGRYEVETFAPVLFFVCILWPIGIPLGALIFGGFYLCQWLFDLAEDIADKLD